MAYTEEQKALLINQLRRNLELTFDFLDAESRLDKEQQLGFYIDAAITFIEREGITLNYADGGDQMLIVFYAAYLYDKRKDGVSVMPRALRINLNNRLFQEKINA